MRNNFFALKTVRAFLAAAVISGCAGLGQAEKRLVPPRPMSELRLEEVEDYVEKNPAKAIHLIGVYENIYASKSGGPDSARLKELRDEAVKNMIADEEEAAREHRWDTAASLARSLKAAGVNDTPYTEVGFLLQASKDYLEAGKNIEAFLAASRVNSMKELAADDALLFFERALKERERGTANFFLSILDSQKSSSAQALSAEDRGFACGKDSARDMIKGVVTVLVDRGIKVQRGIGMADRILGSAFFVDRSGLLITNYHVIASEVDPSYKGYSRLYVRLGDSTGPRIPAKVIGWDKTVDLAVIKAEVKPEYVFSVINRAAPNVGDSIIAIGSPAGLEKTVTSGIVSAYGRRLLQIGDVVQIDAAVNHGNSGGPIIDSEGRLAGIVFAGAEQFEGLNFAIPAERLAAALPLMLKGGKSERPWLGLSLAQTSQGAEIIYVSPMTPAASQLVGEGVFIETINGEKTTAPQGALIAALQDKLFDTYPGELVSLATSNGKEYVLQTAARPAIPLAEAARLDSRERVAAPLFGLMLLPAGGSGWTPNYLVKRVVRGSAADEAGLSPQDPVHIYNLRLEEKDGYALLDIDVKKRASGYIETAMRLPAVLDSPDTL